MVDNTYYIYSLYYDPEFNLFEDQYGHVVYDIFKYLTPSQLELLREKRGVLYTDGPPGVKYEINVPCWEETADILYRNGAL